MCLFDVASDHPPEAVQAMFLDRHPHFESPELTRQLQTIVAEPVPGGQSARFVSKIFRGKRERCEMSLFRADNGTTCLEGNMHPFMKVQRNGIGSLHPRELRLYILSQDGHCTDRTIHMEPEIFVPAQIGDGIQVVHRARIDGACASDHTDGTITRSTIVCDGLF